MKIYRASRYSRAPQLRAFRSQLERLGHTVTSRWIDGGHELTKEGSREADHADGIRFAQEDWEDLLAADCVVSFTEEPRKTTTRGGRHVEFGAALALGKRVVVIGWRENVFHTLPQVEFCADERAAFLLLEPRPELWREYEPEAARA
jgi:nucleoside 2-deoxyribosyltransferase